MTSVCKNLCMFVCVRQYAAVNVFAMIYNCCVCVVIANAHIHNNRKHTYTHTHTHTNTHNNTHKHIFVNHISHSRDHFSHQNSRIFISAMFTLTHTLSLFLTHSLSHTHTLPNHITIFLNIRQVTSHQQPPQIKHQHNRILISAVLRNDNLWCFDVYSCVQCLVVVECVSGRCLPCYAE